MNWAPPARRSWPADEVDQAQSTTSIGERAVRLRSLLSWIVLAIVLAGCSKEIEYTSEQRACIAQHYTNYDASKIGQCVEVCKACMKGNSVTCNTSCRLRGAS